MHRLLLFVSLLFLVLSAAAQPPLARARQRSYLTKVFRLTNEQARHLYEHNLSAARPDFFTQPVDSFPTDKPDPRRPLLPGYYLVAHTEGAQLVYWLRSETDREVVVIDNQVDLTLVVRDSVGRLLDDARVTLTRRPVPFDAATRTYRLANAGHAGLVAVTHAGRTTFHHLEQQADYAERSRPTLGRKVLNTGRRLVFGWPLGYLTSPVWRLGRDLKHASGVSTGLVGLLRSVFNPDVREERQAGREDQQRATYAGGQWESYLALSKPRYRPAGDTLRFKARLLRRPDGRPYRRPLTLWLGGSYGSPEKKIALLRPVRPGSYQYVLPLLDTLGLRANTQVGFRLATAKNQTLVSGHFQLEDYELKSTRYSLRVAEKEHQRGKPQAVFLRGTDSNELNLLDARVRLSVVPTTPPGALPGRQLFVPDTLWTHAQALDALGETRLNLPPAVFPAADFSYAVQATFLNSDNERHTDQLTVPYRLDPGRLTLELRADSVHLTYRHLGRSVPHVAKLTIEDGSVLGQGNPLFADSVRLPLVLPVAAQASSYGLEDAQGHSASLDLDETNGDLTLRSDRTHDSIFLAVDNPRRLSFWYFVYRGARLVYRGYGPAWQLAAAAPGAEAWSVSLHYLWGEEMRAVEYTVALPQRQLVVRTDQPEVAYPGQKIQLKFTVTDGGGRPVPHADLTAYAYTSKFGQAQLPRHLPSFEPAVRGRLSLRRFELGSGFENSRAQTGQQLLAWRQWRTRLGLDSLRFYQFLYPDYGAFYEYQLAPGGITQVAPFVVDSGRVQAPVAVYVDGVPVYVHAASQSQPYALVADSGRHTISIRTTNRLVTLRDVYLRHLHKLTLSIDVNQPCAELTVEKRPTVLLPAEQLTLSRTLLLLDNSYGTLRQGNLLRPVPPRPYKTYALSGPFRPDSVLLRRVDGLRRKFLFEPQYVYSFAPGLLKMTSAEPDRYGSLSTFGFAGSLPLVDFACTEADFQPRPDPATGRPRPTPYWPVIPTRRPVLNNPPLTPAGQGRLEVRLPARPVPAKPDYYFPNAEYLLLTQPGQPKFQRLLAGTALVHALPAGRYRVAVLLADSTCLAPAEDVVVRADGTTYFQLHLPDRQPAGRLSRRIGRLVRARIPKDPEPSAAEIKQTQRSIKVTQPTAPQPGWRTITGRVSDHGSEEGLPGVTVLVKGTTTGTSTNADGTFMLQVPPGSVLRFSSIGYASIESPTDGNDLTVRLKADTKQLSEVVVTGYGVVRQSRELAYSVASVTSNELQGKMAGVMIRGSNSVQVTAGPLIILDGLPFNGRVESLDPATIADTKTMTGADAVALYGARAAAGVIFITTKATGGPADPAGHNPRLALRRRFSDSGWWRPTLVTDARGQASTEVTLPDDVTGWDTFVLGSDDHGRVGTATGRLRSFKALLAELAVPRFLVEGDRAQVLGKVLNYRPDTARVTTTFRVADQPGRSQAHQVSTSALDTLTVTAPAGADSLQLTYSLRQPNGYADGEQRQIPVLPAGVRERVGLFAVLTAADTTLTLPVNPALGEVTVRLESDALPVLLSEIEHLQQYAYLCNEQAASKLKALLLEQRIRAYQNLPFAGARAINFLIRKLQNGRHKPEGLWGTWPQSDVSPWATTHVLEALLAAEQAGYKISFDRDKVQQYLLQELDHSFSPAEAPAGLGRHWYYQSADDQIRLLHMLHQLGAQADYRTYLARLERTQRGRQPLDRYLALTTLRQQLDLPYQLDTLRRYRLQTQLGGIFYDDTLRAGSYYRYLLRTGVGATLLAYRALRAQGGHDAELLRIRTYLLNLRQTSYWSSTYETAQILETIGPDLFAPGRAATFAKAQLSGGVSKEVTRFPQQLTLPATTGPLTLRKEGTLPVYATAYQTRWVPAPTATAAPFTVRTELAGQTGQQVRLRAGQPAELVVTVTVQAEARYVLLEVPIPAGCSYGAESAGNAFEVHREYLRHQTGIFLDKLPVGVHTFRIALQPRYRGRYTLNPAKAELIYFPTRFGRSASKQVSVD